MTPTSALTTKLLLLLAVVSVVLASPPVTSLAEAQEGETEAAAVTDLPSAEEAARQAAADAARTPAVDAERGHALEFEENWRAPSWAALGSTLTLLGGTMLGRSLIGQPETSRFKNTNRMDVRGRDRLRLGERGSHIIDSISDFTLYSLMLWPVMDAAMIGIFDRNPRLAGQLMLMNAQALAMTSFTVGITKTAAGRLRPFQSDCDPAVDPECEEVGASFFSGHTSSAFTGAGLVCVQHRHLDIYGGGWGDKAACGMALTAATATGIFRMMADRHWASDVVVGAAVGLISGWLIPRLLYFRKGRGEEFMERRMERGVITPFGDNGSFGLQYGRTF